MAHTSVHFNKNEVKFLRKNHRRSMSKSIETLKCLSFFPAKDSWRFVVLHGNIYVQEEINRKIPALKFPVKNNATPQSYFILIDKTTIEIDSQYISRHGKLFAFCLLKDESNEVLHVSKISLLSSSNTQIELNDLRFEANTLQYSLSVSIVVCSESLMQSAIEQWDASGCTQMDSPSLFHRRGHIFLTRVASEMQDQEKDRGDLILECGSGNPMGSLHLSQIRYEQCPLVVCHNPCVLERHQHHLSLRINERNDLVFHNGWKIINSIPLRNMSKEPMFIRPWEICIELRNFFLPKIVITFKNFYFAQSWSKLLQVAYEQFVTLKRTHTGSDVLPSSTNRFNCPDFLPSEENENKIVEN